MNQKIQDILKKRGVCSRGNHLAPIPNIPPESRKAASNWDISNREFLSWNWNNWKVMRKRREWVARVRNYTNQSQFNHSVSCAEPGISLWTGAEIQIAVDNLRLSTPICPGLSRLEFWICVSSKLAPFSHTGLRIRRPHGIHAGSKEHLLRAVKKNRRKLSSKEKVLS